MFGYIYGGKHFYTCIQLYINCVMCCMKLVLTRTVPALCCAILVQTNLMVFWFEMLPLFLLPILITQISASCSDISFSECDDFRSSRAILLAIQVPGEKNCRKMCQAVGDGCKFFTFEEGSYQANCQLYRQKLSTFINHCNILGGPKAKHDQPHGSGMCDYDKMEGGKVLDGQ